MRHHYPRYRCSARRLLAAAILIFLGGCSEREAASPAAQAEQPVVPATLADTIYLNANVITMNDAQPTAEAVAVKDGLILAVGSGQDVGRYRDDSTRVHDLGGNTMTPGFIDGHGHLSGVGMVAIAANLNSPPDGPVDSIAGIQQALRDWMNLPDKAVDFGVIFGNGYDDSQLQEKRHPTRDDLDAVSTELPVFVLHQSGHLVSVNSKALEVLGIDAATPDPEGGVIRRRPGSREPDGVLEENASFQALDTFILKKLAPQQALATTEAGIETYATYGYTTAQEGGGTPELIAGYLAAAEQGKLAIDVVAYVYTQALADSMDIMNGPYVGGEYRNGFRIGGLKLSLDGSPQGKTAWLTQPYFEPPHGQGPDYRGYPNMPDEKVVAYIEQAFTNGWQVLAHTNGDAALDQYLDALEQVSQRLPGSDRRSVAIHAQTARADQLDRMKQLGVMPSFFAAHTYYWGDWHRDSVLGPERAANISPTGWALERGMIFTSHHDAPVIPPNSLRVLDATVNRTTRSGQVLGPDQRVEPEVALKALTIWAAWQHGEEDSKGSIEPGKLADFVVLDGNPLSVERARLVDLKVLETIKRGETVYRLTPDAAGSKQR